MFLIQNTPLCFCLTTKSFTTFTMLIKFPPSLTSVIFNIKRARDDGYLLNCSLKQVISLVNQPILHRMGNCMGVKSLSQLSIELLSQQTGMGRRNIKTSNINVNKNVYCKSIIRSLVEFTSYTRMQQRQFTTDLATVDVRV